MVLKLIDIIYMDFKSNLEWIIPAVLCTIYAGIVVLITFSIIPFCIIFYYAGAVLGIGVLRLLFVMAQDTITYLKNCWERAK
jgi:hypothetical protein